MARNEIMPLAEVADCLRTMESTIHIAAMEKRHEDYLELPSFISSLWKDREARRALLHGESVQEAYTFLIEKGNA